VLPLYRTPLFVTDHSLRSPRFARNARAFLSWRHPSKAVACACGAVDEGWVRGGGGVGGVPSERAAEAKRERVAGRVRATVEERWVWVWGTRDCQEGGE
jgi:hypothetical protein